MSYNSKGFTLLELLLVIAIISTLGIVANGFMGRFVNQNSVMNTVDQLAGNFRKAQMYSMMGKYSGSYNKWGVRYQGNTITLFLGNSYSDRVAAFDEVYTKPSSVTVSGFTEVLFDRVTGIPNPTTPLTITVSGGNTTKTVTMNAQGVISR